MEEGAEELKTFAFREKGGKLRVIEGDLDVNDQHTCKKRIEALGIRVDSAVLQVIHCEPEDQPLPPQLYA